MSGPLQMWLSKLTRSQLSKNVAANGAGTVLAAGLTFVGYPLFLSYLGFEQYGVWLAISIIHTIVQLGGIGLGPAVTKFVAEDQALGSKENILACVSTAMTIVVTIGGCATAVLIVASPLIASLFGFQGLNKITAEKFIPWLAVLSAYSLVVQLRTAILIGVGRADLVAVSNLLGKIGALCLSWVLLQFHLQMAALLLGQIAGNAVTHLATTYWSRKVAEIPVFILPRFWRQDALRLVRYGRSILGNSLMMMIFHPLNRMLLVRYSGPDAVPIFEIAWGSAMQIRGVLASALQALLPDFSRSTVSGDVGRVARLLRKGHLLVLISVPLFVGVATFAPMLLEAWLGQSYRSAETPALRITLLGCLISIASAPSYFHLLGAGHPEAVLVSHVLLSFVSLTCAFGLVLADAFTPVTLCTCTLVGTIASASWLLRKSRIALRTLNLAARTNT